MKTKRMLSLVLCVCLVVSLFVGFAGTASAASDTFTYQVKSGDTLYSICKNNGLNYYTCKDAIMVLNNFTSNTQLSKISVGQTLILPASDEIAKSVQKTTTTTTTTTTTIGSTVVSQTSNTSSSSGTTGTATGEAVAMYLIKHTVKSGETLNSICNTYGTSYNLYGDMIKTMSGLTSSAIKAGDTVWIPVGTKPAGVSAYAVVSHKVNSGETIYGLCSTYGINYGTYYNVLKGLNGSVGYIKTGETILMPTTTVASAAVATSGTGVTTGTTTTGTTGSVTTTGGYDITIAGNTTYGTPYATVNGVKVTKATAGSTVVIDGNGNNGYCLETFAVYSADGSSQIKVDSKTKNSFVMPSCAVKVLVSYTAGYSITKEPFQNGTFTIAVNDVISEFGAAGDTVTIQASPNATYVATGVVIKNQYGITVASIDKNQAVTGSLSLKRTSINNYSFVMPSYAVRVEVTFDTSAIYSITAVRERTYSTVTLGTVKFLVNGSEATKVAEGATVTIANTLPAGTIVKSLVIKTASGENIGFARADGDANWYFTMPNQNVTVTVTYAASQNYSITTNVDTGHGTAIVCYNGNQVSSATAGQKITIVPSADSNYTLSDIQIRYSNLSTAVEKLTDTDGTSYFYMPEANVTVYVRFVPVSGGQYHVSKTGAVDLTFMNSVGTRTTTFSAGEKVYVVPSFNSSTSYAEAVFMVDNAGNNIRSEKQADGKFVFTMPAYDCQVWANVLPKTQTYVTVKYNDDPNLSQYITLEVRDSAGNKVADGQQVLAGTVLTITATATDGDYTVKDIRVFVNGSSSGTVLASGTSATYTIAESDTSLIFRAGYSKN